MRPGSFHHSSSRETFSSNLATAPPAAGEVKGTGEVSARKPPASPTATGGGAPSSELLQRRPPLYWQRQIAAALIAPEEERSPLQVEMLQHLTKDHLASIFTSVALDRDRLMLERETLKVERQALGQAIQRLRRERDAALSREAVLLGKASEVMADALRRLGVGQKMNALQRQLATAEEENARLKKRICRPVNAAQEASAGSAADPAAAFGQLIGILQHFAVLSGAAEAPAKQG